MSLSPRHVLWSHQEQMSTWITQGFNRYDIKAMLYEEHGITVGVDSIRAVLDDLAQHAADFSPAAAPNGSRPKPKLRRGDFYPCGRPVEISNRNNRKHGWVAGEAKPCGCLLCGPVEERIRRWTYWTSKGYHGTYLCVGVQGITFGCDQIRICAGPSPEQMICRECFGLPPVIQPQHEHRIVRKT